MASGYCRRGRANAGGVGLLGASPAVVPVKPGGLELQPAGVDLLGGVGQWRGILMEAAASSRRRWAKGGGVELLLRKDDRGKLCHSQMRVGLLLRNSVSQGWKMYKEKRIRAYATTGEYLSGSSIAWEVRGRGFDPSSLREAPKF